MILRRLSEAISRQEWSTIAIELVILVVGIFIGLQVDDWNSNRQDRSDELQYVQRLHEDVLLADRLTQRVRDRLLERLEAIKSGADVLFGHTDRASLLAEECTAVSASNLFRTNAPPLAAFDELVGTGRLEIIRDAELLSALISLEQYRTALAALVATTSADSTLVFLPAAFPELIAAQAYTESDTGEIRVSAECDVDAMKSDTAFLNQFTVNADTYDAFVRDGLAPWIQQFTRVHELLDAALGIVHGD